MKPYADTSFLVSLYVESSDKTPKANAYMSKIHSPLPLTLLHKIEARNAIRLCAHRGLIDENIKKFALKQVDKDLEDGILAHATAHPLEIYRQADELSEKHRGCGTLDLLHVAIAMKLGTTHFLTFDIRQSKLAKLAGFTVPEF